GPASVSIAKTKVDEGTSFGVSQSVVLLKINVQELSEAVGTLKHKIAREFHVPANKQKLISVKAGVLKDNLSLAYYNVGGADHMLFLFVTEP
ncbi:probable splicing factor 3A subunit 1, partial [Tanacetum coccineum]